MRRTMCGAVLVAIHLFGCSGRGSAGDTPGSGGLGAQTSGGSGNGGASNGGASAGGSSNGGAGNGSGAGAGDTGKGGAGGGGTGGADAAGCTDPDVWPFPSEFETRSTTTGDNGALTDGCDVDGNLLEYRCEALPIPGLSCGQPNPDPRCPDRIPTGQAIFVVIDCGGTCVEGVCISHCPVIGEELSYVAVDHAEETATLSNPANGAVYECTLETDWQAGGYDCLGDPAVGDDMTASYFQSQTGFCLENEEVRIQVGLPGEATTQCQYQCVSSP